MTEPTSLSRSHRYLLVALYFLSRLVLFTSYLVNVYVNIVCTFLWLILIFLALAEAGQFFEAKSCAAFEHSFVSIVAPWVVVQVRQQIIFLVDYFSVIQKRLNFVSYLSLIHI